MSRFITALVMMLLAAACGEQARPAPAIADVESGLDLHLSLAVVPDTVAPGESTVARLVLHNGGTTEATLSFGSGQRYDFALLSGTGDTLWKWSNERGFIMAVGEEALLPDAEQVWEEQVPMPADSGSYRVAGWVTSAGAPRAADVPVVVRAP